MPERATTPTAQTERQRWLGILARARTDELEAAWNGLADRPGWHHLRRPEVGLAMVRGRMGGDGGPFNMGEMTVVRCVVQIEGGAAGVGYVAGREARRAELVALFDGLLQDPGRRAALLAGTVEPLAAAQSVRRRLAAAKAASSRVEFFTMVRGA